MAIVLLDDSECSFPGCMHFWCDRSGAVFVCVRACVWYVCSLPTMVIIVCFLYRVYKCLVLYCFADDDIATVGDK